MSYETFETIQVHIDGALATVTISREAALNALSSKVLSELTTAVAELELSTDVRAVIVTGAGKAFVAGADIAEMRELAPREAQAFAQMGGAMASAIEGSEKPWIAAVNGFALGGGCELALACDFIYASRTAKFGLPEVGLGVIPGLGGTQRLPRRIGLPRARELLYTGAVIGADEALRLGLVNAVVEPADLMPRVRAVADAIAARAPLAVAAAKRAAGGGSEVSLAEGLERERALFAGLFATDDQREGMRAFLEKRAAKWTGR